MEFKACRNCRYKNYSLAECFAVCALPVSILRTVENYFNTEHYPVDLEMDLSNIVESEVYGDE